MEDYNINYNSQFTNKSDLRNRKQIYLQLVKIIFTATFF
jgi:hypothetical protein